MAERKDDGVQDALCHDRRIIFYRRYFFYSSPSIFLPRDPQRFSFSNKSIRLLRRDVYELRISGWGSQPGDASLNYLIGRQGEIGYARSGKLLKRVERSPAGFSLTRDKFMRRCFMTSSTRVSREQWMVSEKRGESRQLPESRSLRDSRPLVNRRRMYLRAKLARGSRLPRFHSALKTTARLSHGHEFLASLESIFL